jgi:LacI family transcriptional regulator
MEANEGVSSPPTIYDVAERAGVSIATVSRALNGHSYLRPETRDRVLTAVRELRYVANASARGLSSRSKRVIGLVFMRLPMWDDLLDIEQETLLFTDSIIRGAEFAAQECGYSLLIRGVGDADATPVVAALSGQTDGLILQDRVLSDRKVAPLAKRFPTVLLSGSGRSRTAATVRVDNVGGMQAMAEHLVGHHGFRELAFIGGRADSPDSTTRSETFVATASALGAHCVTGPEWNGDWTSVGALRVVQALLASGRPLPRAIACANDQMAIGAAHALHLAGYRVPQDVALAGFDDIPIARHMSPTLTTVRQPSQQLGRTAAESLVALIEGSLAPSHQEVLPVELVVRGSCGCAAPALGWEPSPASVERLNGTALENVR